jgi:UTP--glucose-1-phosphate uridylyltransferase
MKTKKSQVRKAVFPAAGLGTRFLPATKAQPKEMLPVVDKPIIQYAVEEAIRSGIEDVIVVTGRGKNAIEDHFDVSFELEQILKERGKLEDLRKIRAISDMVQVSYVRQKEAKGLGHAISMAKSFINEEPFGVILADDIIESDVPGLQQLINIYDRYHACVVGVQRVPREEVCRYGVLKVEPVQDKKFGGRLFRVLDMVEKPKVEKAPSDLVILGRYVLTPEIFDMISLTTPGSGGEVQLTDALRSLLRKQPIYGYMCNGRCHDAGDKLGYLKTTVELALRNSELGDSFREYLKSLDL